MLLHIYKKVMREVLQPIHIFSYIYLNQSGKQERFHEQMLREGTSVKLLWMTDRRHTDGRTDIKFKFCFAINLTKLDKKSSFAPEKNRSKGQTSSYFKVDNTDVNLPKRKQRNIILQNVYITAKRKFKQHFSEIYEHMSWSLPLIPPFIRYTNNSGIWWLSRQSCVVAKLGKLRAKSEFDFLLNWDRKGREGGRRKTGKQR